MKAWLKHTLLWVPILLLASCATTGPTFQDMSATVANIDDGMGRIYFYRTTILGAALQPQIMLNGESVGKSVARGFFYVDRSPGNYEVSTSTEVERKLTFTLEEGQERYIRFSVAMGLLVGRVFPELIEESEAREEMGKTHFIGDSLADDS